MQTPLFLAKLSSTKIVFREILRAQSKRFPSRNTIWTGQDSQAKPSPNFELSKQETCTRDF
jgi:hypothetical protein